MFQFIVSHIPIVGLVLSFMFSEMEINWSREPNGREEVWLCSETFRAAIRLLLSKNSPEIQARYASRSNRLRFRSVVTPIILSAYDSIEPGEAVVADKSRVPPYFLKTHEIDWSDIEAAIHALVSAKAIKFVVRENYEPIVYLPSDLITKKKEEYEPNPLDNSRRLDVHLSSDHPEAKAFVDEIYEAHFEGGNTKIRKKHLQVILLNLYVAWCEHPELKIAFWRDSNAYKSKSRYNALFISDKTVTVVDRLLEVGLIDQAKGFKNRQTGKGFISRMWPTMALVKKFNVARFGPFDVDAHSNQECIVLRKLVEKRRKKSGTVEDEVYEKSVDVEYKDTKNTKRMREELSEYNDLLKRTFIDIPGLEVPYIEKEESREKGRLYINQLDKFVRRIFNRGSWRKGGRFWGGWWQRCPKEYRAGIFINDKPTSEIDYSGLHIVILYAGKKIDYWKEVGVDPYTVSHSDLAVEPEHLRSICKQLVLVALNAKDEKSAFQAFRYEAEDGSLEETLKNEQLQPLLQKLREMHRPIADMFASDAGIDLMRIDSEITARIIQYFTNNEIPILTIHDSYVVPMDLDQELEKQMIKAFEEVTGVPGVRLKEETHNPWNWEPLDIDDAQVVGHGAWATTLNYRIDPPRSPRYAHMLEEFRKRVPELDSYLKESRNSYVD